MGRTDDYPSGAPSTNTKLLGSEADGALKNYDLNDVKNQITNTYLRAEVELSAAEMIAETEKTIIAAAGTGKYIIIHSFTAFYNYGSAVFTGSAALLSLFLDAVSIGGVDIHTALTTYTSDSTIIGTPTSKEDVSGYETLPVTVGVVNTTLAVGTGGTLKIVVYYTVEDV